MGWKRWLLAAGVTTGLAIGGSGLAGWLGWRYLSAPVADESAPAEWVRVEVTSGSSVRQIGRQLAAAGVIRSPRAWELWMRWQDLEPKAGTYDLDPRWTLPDIAAAIDSGRGVEEQFTIPEGWRIAQMADYFEQLGWFEAEAFVAETQNTQRPDLAWLPAELPSLEGWLFPNTYQIPLDRRTPAMAVDIMLRQFESVALPLYEDYAARQPEGDRLSLSEWVTFASIVEKEAVLPSERPEIAGVFANRLERGIPLAADPTVEYAFNIRQTPDRRLTFAEVRQPSPYNTYINAGLPPTAIASPGLASLEASLNPAATRNLYFVARYDGSHVFSETLADHLKAQRQILEGRRGES
ncbi:endolytic transglycosylase MltG [Synechococcus sp. PCC 7336]|uniref:endolytic transglycosylase MltG n=1 Tax=Synechococcus sp. PCC 7336 TaxID=195250 RepID=UPI00034A1913|nr:endolytic transglycosylase MltG [Synechococcus sp. PCC 7336]